MATTVLQHPKTAPTLKLLTMLTLLTEFGKLTLYDFFKTAQTFYFIVNIVNSYIYFIKIIIIYIVITRVTANKHTVDNSVDSLLQNIQVSTELKLYQI